MENPQSATNATIPLGVTSDGKNIFLYHTIAGNEKFFQADQGHDGFTFTSHTDKAKIVDEKRRNVNPYKSQDFRIARVGGQYVLLYTYTKERFRHSYAAVSKNLIRWQRLGQIKDLKETGIIVSDFQYQDSYVCYSGESSIRVAYSKDLVSWNFADNPVLTPQKDFFGEWPVKVANVQVVGDGILLLYYVLKDNHHVAINAALFDKQNPEKLLHVYAQPIWEAPQGWDKKDAYPVGIVATENAYISYWLSNGSLFAITHPLFKILSEYQKGVPAFLLKKLKDNPIIKPIADHYWESRAVFNPGALYEAGRVHMVYRAIGDQDVSVLGYASSKDGTNFDERLDEPIYTPTEPFECNTPFSKQSASYSPYASGGGCYGGCEDPRLTKLGDKVYMTYVAYDGWSPPRVALTSISLDDFVAHHWNWKKPVLISKPGQVNKNACILPEKINGKYVVFHRIFPNILVDYVEDLNDFDGKSKWLTGQYKIAPRPHYWDSRKVGVGATPIKTKDGWLLIYQAVGDQDGSRYKMGAMLLDLADPTQVLHRSTKPILEPTEWYENEGYKAGVAYPCGAVTIGNRLHVYYGGADMVTCAATAPLDDFIEHLKTTEEAQLTPADGRPVLH